MRKRNMWWAIGVLTLVGVGIAAFGVITSNVEQPRYAVVATHDSIEIRDYGPMVIAEAETTGPREVAIGAGFRIIAGYIFGNNSTAQKVSMTAPVIQQGSEKIAMTAPVTQQGAGNVWNVRFVMPASYTMKTLPKPNNPTVKLIEMEAKRFAVIRFSGWAGANSLASKTSELEDFIRTKRLKAISAPTYAFYNPPWTLPFFRRNEVMIEVGR